MIFHNNFSSLIGAEKIWRIGIPSPRKIDFRFAESVLKPHALPEYLEGRTPKKNVLSIFKKKFTPAKPKKQETFFFGVAGVLASAWGFLRAYALISLHHARRACDIICFGSRCELGTIETPRKEHTRTIIVRVCSLRLLNSCFCVISVLDSYVIFFLIFLFNLAEVLRECEEIYLSSSRAGRGYRKRIGSLGHLCQRRAILRACRCLLVHRAPLIPH